MSYSDDFFQLDDVPSMLESNRLVWSESAESCFSSLKQSYTSVNESQVIQQ